MFDVVIMANTRRVTLSAPVCILLPILTRNTLDCDQANYSSRIVFLTYLLDLVQLETAPFDPPTPKTPP